MSDTQKNFIGVLSILVLAFCYWYYLTPQGQAWRVNQRITKEWDNAQIKWDKKWEVTKSEPVPIPKEPLGPAGTSEKKVTTTRSSGRHPIQLTEKRNYVTGRNVTFVVPGNMRRIRLKVQDRVGRNISSYTLPNSIISIKPNQRITLVVE